MAVIPRKEGLDADQVGAVRMLAGSTTGYTTEMTKIKHAYDQGVKAKKGIEY